MDTRENFEEILEDEYTLKNLLSRELKIVNTFDEINAGFEKTKEIVKKLQDKFKFNFNKKLKGENKEKRVEILKEIGLIKGDDKNNTSNAKEVESTNENTEQPSFQTTPQADDPSQNKPAEFFEAQSRSDIRSRVKLPDVSVNEDNKLGGADPYNLLLDTFNSTSEIEIEKFKKKLLSDPVLGLTYLLSDLAWVHFAVLKILGAEYTDETRTQIKNMTALNLANNVTIGLLDSLDNKLSVKIMQVLIKFSTQALNKMVDDGVVSSLTSADLVNEQIGGAISRQTESPNYFAIANIIKHNNYMLLNYLTNSDNLSGYTEEMHGGAAFNIATVANVAVDPVMKPVAKQLHTRLEADFFGQKHIPEIVTVINEQILALKENGKKLSTNSYTKVNNVMEAIIDSYNQVNNVTKELIAHNAYPIKKPVIDLDKDKSPYKKLDQAIREKNRNELKGLAISEGLTAVLHDIARVLVSSTTRKHLGLI